jgi:hypothetical protein
VQGPGATRVAVPPGMALATVAIGHGLQVWPKERSQRGISGRRRQRKRRSAKGRERSSTPETERHRVGWLMERLTG